MSKEKYKKLYFNQRPPGYGYFVGQVEDVPVGLAREFIKDGYARDATDTLPNDFPHRSNVISAGIETVEEAESIEDWTGVSGIGESRAEEIAAYLSGEAEYSGQEEE